MPSKSNLPHNPGDLSRSRLGNLEPNQTEDSYTSQVVGQDNRTGDPIVAESGSSVTQSATSEPNQQVTNGATVSVSRDRSSDRQGSRKLSVVIPRPSRGETTATPSQTQPFNDSGDDGCPPNNTIFILNRVNNDEDEPTPEPPPELPPEEPTNPDKGEQDEETPSDPSVPNGCDSESSSQWYRADTCPSGTTNRGSYTDSASQNWVLCEGNSRPQGDGCPYEYPSLGVSYSCINGQCVLNGLMGQYATFEECESSGCQPEETPPEIRYSCASGQCLVDPLGTFTSLSECLSSGCEGLLPGGDAFTLVVPDCGSGGNETFAFVVNFSEEPAPPPFDSPGCKRYTINFCDGTSVVNIGKDAFISATYTCPL